MINEINMPTYKKEFQTIDEYIKTLPKDVQSVLEKTRQTIRKAAPGAVETISYQIPTFKLNDKNLVHFAAFKIISDFLRHHLALKHSRKNYLNIK